MIILYIPFEKNAAGDLIDKAKIWETNASPEEIKIIYYKEDFDEENIPQDTVVYILAHGADDDPRFVANACDSKVATLIDIETLATRFNHDFLVINHCISHIHLYCCGNLGKNASLATNFRAMLLRPERNTINYYQGKIYPPDMSGRLWATTVQGTVAAAPRQLEKSIETELDESASGRSSIKTETMERNFSKSEMSKRQKYQSSGGKMRWRFLDDLRVQAYTSPSAADDTQDLAPMILEIRSRF